MTLLVCGVFSLTIEFGQGLKLSSGTNCVFSSNRRIVIVSSVVPLRPLVDYIDLVYHVSPPGDKRAKMAGMKLRFRFEGKAGGKVKVWWDRPQKHRNRYPYHKFGLGAVEVIHGLKAFDADFLTQVSVFSTSDALLICIRSCSQIPRHLAYQLTAVGLNMISMVTTCWVAASMSISLLNSLAVACSALVCLPRQTR